MMKKEETITIPREWFKRLHIICKGFEDSKGVEKEQWLNHLLGYLASVETILKLK